MKPDAEHLLRELLAFIHGDGGHYVEKFGVDQATRDAMVRWRRAAAVVRACVVSDAMEVQWVRKAVDIFNDDKYRERQKLAAALDKDDPL